MKKVVIITDNIKACFENAKQHGGGYVVAGNLVNAISKFSDVELTVITGVCGGWQYENVKLVELGCASYCDEFYTEIDKYLKENNFDVIISVNVQRMCWNSLLQSQSYRYRCNNFAWLLRPIKKIFSRQKIKKQDEVFSYVGKDTKFIAMSNHVRDDYIKNLGLNPDNIYTIYPACKQIFPEYPGISKNEKITFGVVANSSLNKGGHLLLFVAGLVKCLGFDFKLKMILPKYKKDYFAKFLVYLFGMKSKVEFLGMQENMDNFYSQIDMLVFPSLNEAFGLVILEAMASGVPCLVSSSAGGAEIIGEKDGFIFNRNSLIDFIKNLIKVIKLYNSDFDTFKTYSYNAFVKSKEFTWEKFALNIINKF